MSLNKLAKLKSDHGRIVRDAAHDVDVYEVDNPHVFVQAIGYLKHLAGSKGRIVGLRGQRQLYSPALVPTLFRGVRSQKAKTDREKALKELLSEIQRDKSVLRSVAEDLREPLLQHYGINTRWLDLVDNVWTALWFACHRAHIRKSAPAFLHFERRSADAADRYAYVVIVELERGEEDTQQRGLFRSSHSSWVDLRVGVPSQFIRPHSQHGLLYRRRSYATMPDADCSQFLAGIVRVQLRDALSWLGDGSTLSVHSFFPPPMYDFGYRELLIHMRPVAASLGAIHHVGA